MRGNQKYIRRLMTAVRSAGGSIERVGASSVRIVGPNGVAYCGSKDQDRRRTVSYVRQFTGLEITI